MPLEAELSRRASEKDPELAKGLVLTRKDGAFQFGWTE